MSSFNNQLKILRKEHNLSQQELATKIGISKSSINMYERGEREPGIETVKRIADFFDVDVDYLFGVSDIKKRHSFKIQRINKSISHNIQYHREQAKLSQEQFAFLLNIDVEDVIAIENSEQSIDKEMLYKICDVLRLIPSNFIPSDEDDLDENTEYLLSRRNIPPAELKLTEGEKMLLNLFRKIPEDQQQLVLQMIRAALGSQE